jgi:hypothetical protein
MHNIELLKRDEKNLKHGSCSSFYAISVKTVTNIITVWSPSCHFEDEQVRGRSGSGTLRTHDCVEAIILTKDHTAQLSRFLSAGSVTLEQLALTNFRTRGGRNPCIAGDASSAYTTRT